MADEQDSFVSRWSRRKRERHRGDVPEGDNPPETSESREPAPGEAVDPDRIVESLPDIETLDEDSDFTVFLKDGVPEQLRRRAMRKLWRLNPVFANLDGLNDYDEDFTIAAPLAEGLKTLYQVGKGMVAREEPEGDRPADQSPMDHDIADSGSREPPPESDDGLPDEPEIAHLPEVETGQHGELITANASAGRLAADPGELETAQPAEPVFTRQRGAAARRRWAQFKT